LVVFATGLTNEAESGTRKALKAASMLFFRSLPAALSPHPNVLRDASTGLIWGNSSVVGPSMRNNMSSAGSTVLERGGPAVPPLSAASAMDEAGCGGDVHNPGGTQDASREDVAVGNAGSGGGGVAAVPNGAGATASVRRVMASVVATANWSELPDLPVIVGTTPVAGKRALGADDANSPPTALPPPTPRTFLVSHAMAQALNKMFADGSISTTRGLLGGIMALLKYLYDILLPRVGTTAP